MAAWLRAAGSAALAACGTGVAVAATVSIAVPAATTVTVNTDSIAFSGTAGNATAVRWSTDRDFVGTASGVSNWSATIPLLPGLNRVIIQAHESNASIATEERFVRYLPPGPLGISGITESATTVQRWEIIEIRFSVDNSAATHPQFPYETNLPPGLGWVDGVSVDAYFSDDNWNTTLRRPAFLLQPYTRELRSGNEWMYPSGNPVWCVRFAPPRLGTWQYRIEVREAKGTVQSSPRTFTVVLATNPYNHGPIWVSRTDSRYFEYADGTPYLGSGHDFSIAGNTFSYDGVNQIVQMGAGNQNLFRWWVAGFVWSSAWSPWHSTNLGSATNSPRTGFSVNDRYGTGIGARRMNSSNPLIFYGDFNKNGALPTISGRTYRIRVRWRTVNATGNGMSIRTTSNFPSAGSIGSYQIVVPHIRGTTPWHVATGDFTATGNFAPNICICFEGSGDGYVDECAVHEVLAGGGLGPNLARSAKFNAHLHYDQQRAAAMEAVFAAAQERGMAFRLVIGERNEEILNRIRPNGEPDPSWDEFDMFCHNYLAQEGTYVRRIHEYYWRHLSARFGGFRSIHSWELINEGSHETDWHMSLAAHLARKAQDDGNPHMGSTSIWADLQINSWKDPVSVPIHHTDFHCYVPGTDWLQPSSDRYNDTARCFYDYENEVRRADFGKPTVWGECGINNGNTDDAAGLWLHKYIWARCNDGRTYPILWNWHTQRIFQRNLHGLYGNFNRFMQGIPLTNGRYVIIGATSSSNLIRVLGQKDLQDGRAYLWIDNSDNTWSSPSATPASADITFSMGAPSAVYDVTWYNTRSGLPTGTTQATANSSGQVTLSVVNLSSDTAARLARTGGAPSTPSGLTAVAVSSTRVNLGWTDTAATETGFALERKVGAAGTYVFLASAPANATSWADTGCAPLTTYSYRVRSYNQQGYSGWSNEASVLTPAPPGMPESVSVAADPDTLGADGVSTAQITATVRDSGGEVAIGSTATITFALSGPGTLVGANPVAAVAGVAPIQYRAGTSSGTARITATSPGLIGSSTTITLYRVVIPARLSLSAHPTLLYANGVATSTITARVEDVNGTLAVNSTAAITFTLSGPGTLVGSNPVAASGGIARIVYRTDTSSGLAVVTGSSPGLGGSSATVTVLPMNSSPTVVITSPTPGAVFVAPVNIPITASASDADGTVVRVEFWRGSTLLVTDTASPYAFTWNNVSTGVHTLAVRAYDNAGAWTQSPHVVVTVNPPGNDPPTVRITAPPPGARFVVGDTVTVTASASDADGNVALVEFFVGVVSIGTDTSSPYTAAWVTSSTGTFTLSARAVDDGGAVAVSADVHVIIVAPDVPPPDPDPEPEPGETPLKAGELRIHGGGYGYVDFSRDERVRVRFRSPDAGKVTIVIYDLRGRLLKAYTLNVTIGNEYNIVWNGRTEQGDPVPSGVYLVKAVGQGINALGKIAVRRSP